MTLQSPGTTITVLLRFTILDAFPRALAPSSERLWVLSFFKKINVKFPTLSVVKTFSGFSTKCIPKAPKQKANKIIQFIVFWFVCFFLNLIIFNPISCFLLWPASLFLDGWGWQYCY